MQLPIDELREKGGNGGRVSDLSIEFQIQLQSEGVAWHNVFRDECTPDAGCCRFNVGDYKLRFPRAGGKLPLLEKDLFPGV